MWTQEIHQLGEVATSQPHAAYAGFIHGLLSKWIYLQRTIPDISSLFQPLEDAIQQTFIPALTGRPPCSKLTRDLLALPVRHIGMGLMNPTDTSIHHFQTSEMITSPLTEIILSQDQTKDVDPTQIATLKKEVRKANRSRNEEKADTIYNELPPQLKRQIDLAKERESSSWLSVLPPSEQGFHLHKGKFRDAVCLRYGWVLPNTPRLCNCGKAFQIDHAMTCHMGDTQPYATMRSEIRRLTCSPKCAQTWPQNPTSNPYLEKLFTWPQRMQPMVQDWTYAQEASGLLDKTLTLMSGSFTQMLQVIDREGSPRLTKNIKMKRKEHTAKESEK